MTIEDIKAVFPLEGRITAKIIKTADIWDTSKCIGAQVLRSALRKKIGNSFYTISWGYFNGSIYLVDEDNNETDEGIMVTTVDNVSMMDIKDPMTVTFIVV